MAGIAGAVIGSPGSAAAGFVPAYAALFERDAPGASDDPLIVRFPGSHILTQTTAAYDELKLPSGPAPEPTYSDKKRFSRMVTAEGRVTRTVYIAPPGASSLQLLRSIEGDLVRKGWKPAWQCAEAACGPSFARLKYSWQDKSTLVRGERLEVDRGRFVDAVFDSPKAIRYTLLQKGAGPKAAYVGVYAALNAGGTFGDMSDTLDNRVTALVEVVEPKAS